MCSSETGTYQRNRQVGRGGIYGLPLWHGGGDRYLGSAGGSGLEKRNPRAETPLCPDGWSASARELYFSILGQADEVVYVSREYRDGCMLKRNRYLVDHAACLLAVYNGEWRGGTAMTVRYARKKGREIIIINPV